MGNLSITEHYHGGVAGMPVVKWPRLARQNVLIGGAAVSSAPFSGETRMLRVNTDVACCIRVTPPGVATIAADVGDARFAPNQTEYLEVDPGATLSVIQTV